jgi:hypothetical protein
LYGGFAALLQLLLQLRLQLLLQLRLQLRLLLQQQPEKLLVACQRHTCALLT